MVPSMQIHLLQELLDELYAKHSVEVEWQAYELEKSFHFRKLSPTFELGRFSDSAATLHFS